MRRGSGVTVIAPKITTRQIERTDALVQRLMTEPSFVPAGGQVTPGWFVNYKGSDHNLPQSADAAWTQDLVGSVDVSMSSGLCLFSDLGAASGLLYYYTADLTNATGTTFEARLKVTSADVAQGSGFLLRVEDGAQRFDVYCRTGDLNIDDGSSPAATVDLTSFRWLQLGAQGTNLLVSVDGNRLCVGGPKAASTEELVAWGTTSGNIAVAQVRNVRGIAKRLW